MSDVTAGTIGIKTPTCGSSTTHNPIPACFGLFVVSSEAHPLLRNSYTRGSPLSASGSDTRYFHALGLWREWDGLYSSQSEEVKKKASRCGSPSDISEMAQQASGEAFTEPSWISSPELKRRLAALGREEVARVIRALRGPHRAGSPIATKWTLLP